MPNKNIKNHISIPSDAFVTWDSSNTESLKAAQLEVGKAYASVQPIMRESASITSHFDVRRGMSRKDYEVFRPGETVPNRRDDVLAACMQAYKSVSPVKNIIDMMVDFTTEGIRLVHPQPQVQQFHQNWWKKVDGTGRSQHFSSNFYLLGTAIPKRTFAKLSQRVIDSLQKGYASAADSEIYDIQPELPQKQPKNVIPWSYDFLNPELVKVIGGELGLFSSKPRYCYEIPERLYQIIKNPRTAEQKLYVGTLPAYITTPVKAGSRIIILDESRISVYHYKKNDWQQWADPILYSIMDDLILLQKMKMTDLAALDGAISHIRIWKLGSLEHKIMPTEAAFQKLNDVLIHAGNGQSFDLIWGPDLTLEETSSEVYKYLGKEKYEPVYSAIFSGMGVPPSLVGGDSGGGFTNNFLSIKTLIERLNYGREALKRFWENEVKIIQQAMQFRFPAQIEFKNAVMTDEAAFHSMLIDLLDRDVISVERVREHLGYIPEIEESLVKYEWNARKKSKTPPKAGPFHSAEQEFEYKKIFATAGVVTPGQLGLELDDAKPGEKNTLEIQNMLNPKVPTTPQKKGQQGQGRPRNSKDTTPRKSKRVTPRTSGEESEFMSLLLWAKDAQQEISNIVNPVYLQMCNKKNMRTLTTAQTEDLEHLKFAILCNLEPHSEISQDSISKLINDPLPAHPEADNYWKVMVKTYMDRRQEMPTLEDIKQIQSYVYAMYKGEYNGQDYSEC